MSLSESHKNKCGHEPCACTVDPGEHYCSEYCARVSPDATSGNLPGERQAGGPCHCGHPPCR